MRILTLHCDYIKFRPIKKAIAKPEETKAEEKKVEECLVVLIAVEKQDEGYEKEIVKRLAENVKEIASQVKTHTIVLYPYVHLTSVPSRPDVALFILEEAEKALKELKEFKIERAPFGWYKEFELKCKGHPLSELSREIVAEGKKIEMPKIKAEKKKIEKIYTKSLLQQISKVRLDTSKLKENDHRILGEKLNLFSLNEVAPGMVFWHPKGLIIWNELINFWRQEHKKAGYQEISTPQLMDLKLWKISGHFEKYRENMFYTEYEKKPFVIKPMNCPGCILVYRTRPRSYKELPLRLAELGTIHRKELSGVLAGLFRVIKCTQDDAHIFCTEEQLEPEISAIISLIDKIYKKFNFNYHLELSTRPKERIGSDALWDKAEKALEAVLKKKKMKFKLNKGEGAFYGPKIDFHIKDSLGRTWQCGTIQLDFAMPERFELVYGGKDNKLHRPIMIHRAVFGSLERFIGILLECSNGSLPLWLSPVQVRVLSFTERNVKAAQKILEKLEEENIRVEPDFRDCTVDYKVRDAEMQRVFYTVVIGDKEEKTNTLAVRERGKRPKFGVKLDDFIKDIKEKIKKRE